MRLIDLDEIETPMPSDDPDYFEMLDYLDELKSIGEFELIFCPNCRFCHESGGTPHYRGYLYCKKKGSLVDETDFCSWGKER